MRLQHDCPVTASHTPDSTLPTGLNARVTTSQRTRTISLSEGRFACGFLASPCGRERSTTMAKYLFQATYTSEAWAAQVRNPQNRVEAIRPVIERFGGRLESAYYAFGEYDVVV